MCLEAPEELTPDEIGNVVTALPERGLVTVIGSLARRLGGGDDERGRVWREKLHPWLGRYWPRAEGRNTEATSEAILEMIAKCGDAFPDAATWPLDFLKPIRGRGLHPLESSGHARRYPEETLRLLDRVVSADVLKEYRRPELVEVLDAMKSANPDMTANPRFQKLFGIASS